MSPAMEERVSVPPSLLPEIVGTDDCHLERVENKTGAQLRFHQADSIIVVRSEDARARRQAVAMLDRWITEMASAVASEVLLVPAAIVDDLVGSQGSELEDVERRAAGARCTYRGDPSNRLLGVLLSVRGDLESRSLAMDLLRIRRRELMQSDGATLWSVPRGAITALMGKDATGVRRITQLSGGAHCRVHDVGVDGDESSVEVRGTGVCRQRALYYIDAAIRQMMQESVRKAPEEAHMILSPPFPVDGIIFVRHVPHVGRFVLDARPNYNESLQSIARLNCVTMAPPVPSRRESKSLHAQALAHASPKMTFNCRQKTELVAQVVDRVVDFVGRVARRQFDVVKLELSVGKQTLDVKDDYPPTEFKVPDACITRPNSSVPNTGAYFKDAQFHQSLSDNVAERALSQLMRMGFSRRDAAVDNGDVVDGSETAVYKTTSLDVLWKSSATKEFFMTKFQQVGENRSYAFVSSAEQRIKPIALTFMHPVGFADFRVRLIVRSQKDASDASPHIQELAECMCITDDPISHVEIAYPDSLGVTHERIRMRKKKKLMLDGMKATLEQLTDIQTVYLPAATSSDDVDSVEEDSRSGDGDVLPMPSIRRSHELRFKSERLERLIEKYVRNYDSLMTDGRTKTALDHVKQSGHGEEDDDLTADLDETTEFDSAATHADLRSSLEQEIGKLLVFGDQFTSQLEWDFGEQAAAEQEDSDGASFDLNV